MEMPFDTGMVMWNSFYCLLCFIILACFFMVGNWSCLCLGHGPNFTQMRMIWAKKYLVMKWDGTHTWSNIAALLLKWSLFFLRCSFDQEEVGPILGDITWLVAISEGLLFDVWKLDDCDGLIWVNLWLFSMYDNDGDWIWTVQIYFSSRPGVRYAELLMTCGPLVCREFLCSVMVSWPHCLLSVPNVWSKESLSFSLCYPTHVYLGLDLHQCMPCPWSQVRSGQVEGARGIFMWNLNSLQGGPWSGVWSILKEEHWSEPYLRTH